ncbi:hypothetical protein PF005_g20934 [Phytophthora fragariae]|uniref:Uncharacterized protein n=2 Tax=Phytophthora fragariae TaxID=53985 RepID=A0A6A3HWS3_9STRA|nr:hypothetical protein PF003_g40166 [Phytophthora fragariae]KAE8928427.1 hypothetical protein PF009_g21428 [Phytophthora fragariae]KAE8973857.1 hypothetical protein PF011_g25090 [Phytophthora fragariae]KAE9083700.1 hypothetical protein PF007_g21799 [Phytophthora fragariae]KAE9113066.1 hypothetical protein PF006_g19840 [Phytophthora fragariae]
MCSNAVHEGALDTRVCSHRCAEALGLTNQQSSSNTAPTSRVAPKQSGNGGKSGQAKTKANGKATRKRGTQPHAKTKDTISYKSKATSTKSRHPPVKKRLKKGEEAVADDGEIPGNDSAVEAANGVLKKAKISGSTTTSTQGKRSAVRKTSGMQSTTGGSEWSALLERCSNNGIDSADDGRCGSDVGIDADGDEPNSKPKKFYFTPAKDLDLLMEVLNVRPYAAKHGFVSERYEVVTSNLNEHWETELCARTFKERFFRLVEEFKATDSTMTQFSPIRNPTKVLTEAEEATKAQEIIRQAR